MKRTLYILLYGVICLQLACKPTKLATDTLPTLPEETHNVDVQDAMNALQEASPEWYSSKCKIKVTDKEGSSRGLLFTRIKRDSVIWMVFKKHSYEAVRIQINTDSMVVLDRFNKEYQTAQLDSLSNIFGLVPDLSFMSHMMMGIPPRLNEEQILHRKEEEDNWLFRALYEGVIIDFNITKAQGINTQGQFYDQFTSEGEWEYADFNKVLGYDIPFERKFHIKFDHENFMRLEFDIQEVHINKPYNLKFEIPDHYNKIE